MKLTQSEIELFFKLWYAIIWGINEKNKIVPGFKMPVYGEDTDRDSIIAVRAEMWDHPEMIDEFVRDKEFDGLTEADYGIITDWRNHFVKSRFIIIKHLAKYSVLMPFDGSEKLYGVYGISGHIKETVFYTPPVMVETVLLPFKDRIIYDGFMSIFSVSFGKGIRGSFNEVYKKTKEETGIIESMSAPPVPAKPPVKKEKPPRPAAVAVVDTKGAKVPKEISARYMEIAEIIEAFCDEELNEEFKEICLRALAKLCRKRPSPVWSGKAYTWASGIVYAIGSMNFIFDRAQPYYMTATDLADWFGLSKSTARNKAAEITRMLNLSYFNAEFSLKRFIEENPFRWYRW